MEVDWGVGHVVDAVGGGGQGGAGLHHQTSGQTTTRRCLLDHGGSVHVQRREQGLHPHSHLDPRAWAEPWTRTSSGCRSRSTGQPGTRGFSPVLRAQRVGPRFARGGEDTCRVGGRWEKGLVEGGLWRVGGMWKSKGEVGGAGGREGGRGDRVCLDGQDLGRGTTRPCGAAGVQDEEAGSVLL